MQVFSCDQKIKMKIKQLKMKYAYKADLFLSRWSCDFTLARPVVHTPPEL